MKVLVVTQYFWPENFRINDLAIGLVERGHEVTVLTGIPNYPQGSFFAGYGFFRKRRGVHHGVRICRVPIVPRGTGGGVQLGLNYLSFVLSAVLFSPFCCRGPADVIIVSQLSPVTAGLPALFLKRVKKAPILFWVLDLWPESLASTGAVRSERWLGRWSRLVGFIYRGCDRIVVASRAFLPSITARGVPIERTGYLPNWNEPEYEAPSAGELAVASPVLPPGFKVMFAGNIGVAQDFGTILGAAEKLKAYTDISWVILGDGRRSEWVKEEVARRGLQGSVHLLGRHPSESMLGYFAQADAMLVTLKREPSFALTVPGKIQSYMACGRPIVAALDGEGARLIRESGAGIATPAEDADALAEAVLSLYRMPREERETMGAQGKAYCAAHFDREVLFDRVDGWIRELAATRGA